MAKIYASFSDPALAEKATGALLDNGMHSEDISLIRGGNQEDYDNWQMQNSQTYGNVHGGDVDHTPGTDFPGGGEFNQSYTGTSSSNMAGSGFSAETVGGGVGADYAPEAMRPDALTTNDDYTNRTDTQYVYENQPSDRELSDPQARAADYNATTDYADRRVDDDTDKNDLSAKTGISTTTAADAGAGAAKGAGVGLALGILAGVASLFVPGLGLIVGGGALATAIGGAVATTAGGAIAGAVTGYLKDQGVEEHLATTYGDTLSSGGALLELTIPSGDVDEMKAREVLMKYGAGNVGAFTGSSSTGGYVS